MNAKIEKLEAQLATAESAQQRIDALNALAWELHGLESRGLVYAQTALELAQTEQYQKGIADSLVSQCEYIFSDFDRLFGLASQALVIFEQLGDRRGQCRAMYCLCAAYWFADYFVESIEVGRRGQTLAQEIGDRELEGDLLNNMGLTYKRAGNYELAYTMYGEALAIFRALADRLREGKVLINLALAYAEHGNYDQALHYAHEYEQRGGDHPRAEGYRLFVLGQVYSGKREFDQALHYLHRAAKFASEHADYEQLAEVSLRTIAQVYLERQEPDLAIAHLHQGLAVAQGIQSNLYVYRFHEMLARVYESRGDLEQALFHYKQFHTIKETVFNDKNTSRRQALEIQHQTEIARREAEIYHLRNVKLEQEIAERKRLQEELRLQATTDELTRVFNRRHFFHLVRTELQRAVRLHHPIAIALIDLDHFKQVNDTYGHIVGDQALVALATAFQNNIRQIDVFARIGGDEFALLLPETDGATACQVVERVQCLVAAQRFALNGSSLAMTISAGIACLEGETSSVDTLITRADQAVYRAKEQGRNCVVLFQESEV